MRKRRKRIRMIMGLKMTRMLIPLMNILVRVVALKIQTVTWKSPKSTCGPSLGTLWSKRLVSYGVSFIWLRERSLIGILLGSMAPSTNISLKTCNLIKEWTTILVFTTWPGKTCWVAILWECKKSCRMIIISSQQHIVYPMIIRTFGRRPRARNHVLSLLSQRIKVKEKVFFWLETLMK